MKAEAATTVAEKSVELSMMTVYGVTFNVYAVILGFFLLLLFVSILVAQRRKRLDWLDLLTRDGTKVSTTKILQLVGGIVGTWVMVKTTLQGNITWDLLAIYLGYVASVDGFSKLLMAKYGGATSDDSNDPYRRGRFDRNRGRGRGDDDDDDRGRGRDRYDDRSDRGGRDGGGDENQDRLTGGAAKTPD